jgi:hypothetical protein
MPAVERSLEERIEEALAHASLESSSERATVAALCRRAGISRTALYRLYPEAARSIRRLRERTQGRDEQVATIRRLRADLACANTLAGHLTALLDHYAGAYREIQELLARRDRELAELRRSSRSSPTALRRTRLT